MAIGTTGISARAGFSGWASFFCCSRASATGAIPIGLTADLAARHARTPSISSTLDTQRVRLPVTSMSG